MRYMLLIYAAPNLLEGMTEAEQQARSAEYLALSQEMNERGIRAESQELQPINTATTVRVRDGKISMTDGPFAETQGQLIRYYVLVGKNLDEALDYAIRIPDARAGAVEVRPLYEPSETAQ